MAVVLNHTQITSEVKTIIYLVCLPAFFFTSGFFSKDQQLSPFEYFKQKTLRLLFPYIIFGVLSWLAWLVIGRKYGADSNSDIAWWVPLVGLLRGREDWLIQNRPLWFLCCLISVEWIFYITRLIFSKRLQWVVVIGISIFGCIFSYIGKNLYWEISAACIVLPLYILGADFAYILKTKSHFYNTYFLFILLMFASVGIVIGYIFNGNIEIHKSHIGNPILFYITALSVIGFWLSVSIFIERRFGAIKWLQYIGQNTLIILCTHIPLFGAIKGVSIMCCVPIDFFNTNIGSLLLWLGSILVLFPIIYIINRFFPWLLGKHLPNP